MILDLLSQAPRYAGLGPRISIGLDWLARFDPHTADGRYDLDDDNVYALVQSYDTVPPAEKKFESVSSSGGEGDAAADCVGGSMVGVRDGGSDIAVDLDGDPDVQRRWV